MTASAVDSRQIRTESRPRSRGRSPRPGDLDDLRVAPLSRQRDTRERHAFGAERHRLRPLQGRHDAPHVAHADLRVVGRLRQTAGRPPQDRGRSLAHRHLVHAALDPLEDLQRPVGAEGQLVHALELVHDAEPLADDLHRRPGTAACRLPPSKQQKPRAVEPLDRRDGVGQQRADFGRLGEPPAGPSRATSSKEPSAPIA
jgi:hypothetical protein